MTDENRIYTEAEIDQIKRHYNLEHVEQDADGDLICNRNGADAETGWELLGANSAEIAIALGESEASA